MRTGLSRELFVQAVNAEFLPAQSFETTPLIAGYVKPLYLTDKPSERVAKLKEQYKQYFDNFSNSDGRIVATFELIFLTGWAPSSNQQKPLMPGTAKVRLADALRTVENKLEKD